MLRGSAGWLGMLVISLVLGATSFVSAGQSRPDSPGKPAPAFVNVNTATVAQLETLPGIGAKTAQRIVEYRQKNGGFKKIEELMNVKGIGEKSFLRLKHLITVVPPKTERAQ